MNWKISRNEKHKYTNKEKLAFGETENTSTLINIAQEDDNSIFELLQNLYFPTPPTILRLPSIRDQRVTIFFIFRNTWGKGGGTLQFVAGSGNDGLAEHVGEV